MRSIILLFLLVLAGCSSYHNPSLDPSVDKAERFKKDRSACLDRAKKTANSEPGNDLRFLKTYDQQQQESTRAARAFKSSHRQAKAG
ncbi:hypothetical protein [Maridesulfovibrio hydrothermalis]|uniref:Lipoprotein n=1 Tax=Maridesulfovibrio hydrothermalis AM13 = DSM 14728 TaxID=1121451 RepID=L0RGG3_9BACT|nr:hypothetical protein [Maridesulfovibrio hydrothermalis]CCO25305.1 conserved exported protein of unknown function [Maridesulfovibrio hydrothermalis AM13 = DSM 14728]